MLSCISHVGANVLHYTINTERVYNDLHTGLLSFASLPTCRDNGHTVCNVHVALSAIAPQFHFL